MNERTENVHQREKIIVTKPNLPDTSRPRRKRRSIAEREATNSRRSGVPHQHPARLAPASERDADWPKIERMCARMQCESLGPRPEKAFAAKDGGCAGRVHTTQRKDEGGMVAWACLPTRTGVTAPALRLYRARKDTTTTHNQRSGAFS